LAVAIGGAVFGITTAVQASIPDANGVVHACYNTSLAHGSPTGALRAIDTSAANGNCAPWEGAVDLATPQFVTSTINQTSFTVSLVDASLTAGQWVASYFCPAGYVATDPAVGDFTDSVGNEAYTVHSLYNVGAATTGVMNTTARLWFVITSNETASIHATCVDGRVFGLAGPAAPINQAKAQATISIKPA
jgi:hypothetical protein